ncbi:MAG: SMI1/KNR4 family protein [Pirellulales bacterium]
MASITSKLTELGIEPMSGPTFKPFSKQNIAQLQDKTGASFPEAYQQFLLTYGHSMFSGDVNCTPQGDPLYFGWFYGFNELVDAVDTYREVLPETMIPIGDDGGGNQFCLGVSGKDFGKVYFHNHGIGWHADAEAYRERGEEIPADIRYQTVFEVAPSFEQFILSMVKED